MDAVTYPVFCRYCSKKFESYDSYSDSYEMLDFHIGQDHPNKTTR